MTVSCHDFPWEGGLREGAHAENFENHYHKGTKNTVFFNYVLFYGCLNICIRQKDKLNTKLDFLQCVQLITQHLVPLTKSANKDNNCPFKVSDCLCN